MRTKTDGVILGDDLLKASRTVLVVGLAQLLTAARAAKTQPFLLDAFETLLIISAAFGLPQNRLITVQTMRVQRCENGGFGSGRFAGRIQIFNAYEPVAIVGLGVQVADYGGKQRTKMQRPGGRGSKAAAIGGHENQNEEATRAVKRRTGFAAADVRCRFAFP